MPYFKFIGQYTNGQTSISASGVTFEGNDPAEVTDPEAVRRLSHNVEFEEVHALDHDGDGKKGGSPKGPRATARRKPKKKVAS